MTTDVFVLTGDESTTHPVEIVRVGKMLIEKGEVRISFATAFTIERGEETLAPGAQRAVDIVLDRLALIGPKVVAHDVRAVVKSSVQHKGLLNPPTHYVDVVATLMSTLARTRQCQECGYTMISNCEACPSCYHEMPK